MHTVHRMGAVPAVSVWLSWEGDPSSFRCPLVVQAIMNTMVSVSVSENRQRRHGGCIEQERPSGRFPVRSQSVNTHQSQSKPEPLLKPLNVLRGFGPGVVQSFPRRRSYRSYRELPSDGIQRSNREKFLRGRFGSAKFTATSRNSDKRAMEADKIHLYRDKIGGSVASSPSCF